MKKLIFLLFIASSLVMAETSKPRVIVKYVDGSSTKILDSSNPSSKSLVYNILRSVIDDQSSYEQLLRAINLVSNQRVLDHLEVVKSQH